jgi:ATP:corrinoid adenosyltransferase
MCFFLHIGRSDVSNTFCWPNISLSLKKESRPTIQWLRFLITTQPMISFFTNNQKNDVTCSLIVSPFLWERGLSISIIFFLKSKSSQENYCFIKSSTTQTSSYMIQSQVITWHTCTTKVTQLKSREMWCNALRQARARKQLKWWLTWSLELSLIPEVLVAPSVSLLSCTWSCFVFSSSFKFPVLSQRSIIRVQGSKDITHPLVLWIYVTKFDK